MNQEIKTLTAQFKDNLLEAFEIQAQAKDFQTYSPFSNIAICGLGGSGIGGRIVANWFREEIKIPVSIFQGYSLPASVNENTLLIACSYSGDTEETISCVREGQKRGSAILAICSGGELLKICEDKGYDHLCIPGGKPPRTQLAYSLVFLTSILVKLNLIHANSLHQIKKGAGFLANNEESIHSEARRVAELAFEKQLVIYSDDSDEAIAIRARQQFNENAKSLCWHHVIPEMNHNELVGWGGGMDSMAVLLLRDKDTHPQNTIRFEYSQKIINGKTKHLCELWAKGNNPIEKDLFLIHVVDWASVYLADLKQVYAIEIDVINELKHILH